jgi:hypothetical protein
MNTCRFYLDSLLEREENALIARKVAIDGELAVDPVFESGVIKLMRDMEEKLTEPEIKATKQLLVGATIEDRNVTVNEETDGIEVIDNQLSLQEIFERSQKKRKVLRSKYLDLSFISPVIVFAERVFSSAGQCFSRSCRSLHADVLEEQLFLKYNRDFWNL